MTKRPRYTVHVVLSGYIVERTVWVDGTGEVDYLVIDNGENGHYYSDDEEAASRATTKAKGEYAAFIHAQLYPEADFRVYRA